MIKANQIYYLQNANDSICVFMLKSESGTVYKFYDTTTDDSRKLKIALFSVAGKVALCYELSDNGMIIAEDTSNLLHPNIIPGLIAAIFFDVF